MSRGWKDRRCILKNVTDEKKQPTINQKLCGGGEGMGGEWKDIYILITVPVKIILGGHNRSIEPGTGLYLIREQSIRTSRRALYGDAKCALPAVI
jgi:hypothetical protein